MLVPIYKNGEASGARWELNATGANFLKDEKFKVITVLQECKFKRGYYYAKLADGERFFISLAELKKFYRRVKDDKK